MAEIKEGLKKWLEAMGEDEAFSQKFVELEEPEDVVALANKEGYEFTIDDFMDLEMELVSGGANFFEKTNLKIGNAFFKGIGWLCDKVFHPNLSLGETSNTYKKFANIMDGKSY